MAGTETFRILSKTHVNRWNQNLQTAEPGWDIKALWVSTGTTIPVFVPDSQYTAENVDQAIRHLGALDERVHALGS